MGDLITNKRRVVGVPQKREQTIAILNECFSKNMIDMDEFEQRLEQAEKAKTIDELEDLLADVPMELLAPKQPDAPKRTLSPTQSSLSIMGSKTISGSRLLTKSLNLLSVMSSMEIDYRHVELPAGVIDVNVVNVMASCSIIIPPGVRVENEIISIMASVEEDKSLRDAPADAKTVIRLKGVTVMASVEIRMKA